MITLSGFVEKRNVKGTKYFENENGEVIAKECTKCGEIKGKKSFYKDRRKSNGLRASCKECQKEGGRKYYEENKERKSLYYEENKEREKKRRHQHYQRNKERYADRHRRWITKNQEWYVEYHKKYYEENKERYKEYYEENKERISAIRSQWGKENKELIRLASQRRRARKKSLPDTLSKEQQTRISNRVGGVCYLTGESNVHIEHAIPLSIGHGGTTLENCYLLRNDLNESKGDSNIFEWFKENKHRFKLSQRRFDELITYLSELNGISTEEYREFVYWCHDNPRTVGEIESDNKRYGYKKPSIEIWSEQRTEARAV